MRERIDKSGEYLLSTIDMAYIIHKTSLYQYCMQKIEKTGFKVLLNDPYMNSISSFTFDKLLANLAIMRLKSKNDVFAAQVPLLINSEIELIIENYCQKNFVKNGIYEVQIEEYKTKIFGKTEESNQALKSKDMSNEFAMSKASMMKLDNNLSELLNDFDNIKQSKLKLQHNVDAHYKKMIELKERLDKLEA